MNEWLKKFLEQVKGGWSKWSLVQRIMFIVIVVAVIGALAGLVTFSSRPSMVPLLTTAITDQEKLSEISLRLDEEKVEHTISAEGRIFVKDKITAQRMVSILMREDLIPKEVSPWDVFKLDRWTITDFERNVNLRRAITDSLEQHIEALADVDDAEVTLVMPETELFSDDQQPVTASVIITPSPGSGISTNRAKIEGIVKLVRFAVEGLQEENIVISDHNMNVLNDFEDLADFDRLELTKRQLAQKDNLEKAYRNEIQKALMQIFGEDRVRVLKVDIDLDMSKRVVETEEFFPITMVPDNPATPYSELQVVPSVTRSKEVIDEQWKGTGFNPEGPPGVEGQVPPSYKDADALFGEYKNNSVTQNEEVNQKNTYEEKTPWVINRISVGAAIDGLWRREYTDKGTVKLDSTGSIVRNYTPVSDEDLAKARTLVEHAIGYDRNRGDSVSVEHLQFDRTAQFAMEDEEFRARQRLQQMIIYSLIAVAVLIIALIVFRLISRELERRRRLREEELSRQHQAMREAALRSAEEEGVDVEMSVEERARLDMQEHAINMAREHPEDVAQLIRTWLLEE
ncbi:flagellar M-ring protein FliF [Marispirochaeta aestuarii]|uniref:Flagellar M-ring protein n=1 Tax=Marispirochaeta aestuarii TaxID=1963862 RepID=A0A1Y1RW26_9SPIO|nr:flagellar basal-body MS-ring/collar protein FliF [Marispirochaeta aestuarii]ORC34279.1 flagellar M-ring protein FliF [Marispirochaeta aestuarii]